jgi:NADH dehydrogenase [ubiquinone] 1 alpha subcomplex assembly factor 7
MISSSTLPIEHTRNFPENPSTLPKSSEFLQYLRQRIKATGAISVAEYMKECLTNPYYGYYSRKNPIGRQGDFITAPEVCQIFGELVALWCVNEWSIASGPTPFQIIELGPGTGTLAWDLLRIFNSFSQIKDSVSLHLVERSTELARLQAEKLGVKINQSTDQPPDESPDGATTSYFQHGVSQFGIPVFWYQRIEDIPKAPAFIVANEFFDALPIHKLQKTEKGTP